MVASSEKLSVVNFVAEQVFNEVFSGKDEFAGIYSKTVPVSAITTAIAGVGSDPVALEWTGERIEQSLRAFALQMVLKKYHLDFSFDRMQLDYDQTGAIGEAIRRIVSMLQYSYYEPLAFAALVANKTGYDGVPLYSAIHPFGPSGATQSNTTTSQLSFATFDAAMASMMSIQTERGNSVPVQPKVLMVGPSKMRQAWDITGSKTRVVAVNASGVEAGSSVVAAATIENHYEGGSMITVVNNRLVGSLANRWYLFADPKLIPAVIIGRGRDPQFIPPTMESPDRVAHDRLVYRSDADLAFEAGIWQGTYGGLAS